MRLRVLINTCLISCVLASCGVRDDSPDDNGTTNGTSSGTTTGSTTSPLGGTNPSTTTGEASNDGTYFVDVMIDANQGPECEETDGSMTVANNVITGSIESPVDVNDLVVSGQIDSDGNIFGEFRFSGGASYAIYTGYVISTGDFEGDWIDDFGCAGSWAAVRN